MLRTSFLALCLLAPIASKAYAIEIYVNGHEYNSIQAYQASKKASAPMALNTQDKNYVQQEAQRLGVKVDFSKMRTFQLKGPEISQATRHKLYVLSVEQGMVMALQDFYHTWSADLQSPTEISSQQVQRAIQQAVAASQEPKLLISSPGKLRIMRLTAQDPRK